MCVQWPICLLFLYLLHFVLAWYVALVLSEWFWNSSSRPHYLLLSNSTWAEFLLWGLSSNPSSTTDSHLKRIISTNCCIHTVVPPDDGSRYARNMYRLTKYTKNKLCIKLGFLYTRSLYYKIISGPCLITFLSPGITSSIKFWCFADRASQYIYLIN